MQNGQEQGFAVAKALKTLAFTQLIENTGPVIQNGKEIVRTAGG